MTSWSLVALAAILCATLTICWGLWLNAIYLSQLDRLDDVVETDDQVTREWPNTGA